MIKNMLLPLLFFVLILPCTAQTAYQTPPKPIEDLVNAPQTPLVSVNNAGDWALLLERPSYPSIVEVAQPELRLAGMRINPANNGSSRGFSYNGLLFKSTDGKKEVRVEVLPQNPVIQNISWSPDGKQIAFTMTHPEGIALYTASIAEPRAKKLTAPVLNDTFWGNPYEWHPDNKRIMFMAVPADRGPAPVAPIAPEGPVIQENRGKVAPSRTYQDLLANAYDEALFDHYFLSEVMVADLNGNNNSLGVKGTIRSVSIAPGGGYFMVQSVNKPYSYLVPASRFPLDVAIHDLSGKLVKKVASLPLIEELPKGFGATWEGPRSFTWRADKPATLYWVEAQDGGDPAVEAAIRDRMYYLPAPFEGAARPGIELKLRYAGVTWGDDNMAIAYETWFNTRQAITSTFKPEDAKSKKVLFDRSYEDRYNDPGNFVTTDNQYGKNVLLMLNKGRKLLLTGQGASPEGNRPFIDEMDMRSMKAKRLWQSEAPYYESPVSIIDPAKGLVITRRESEEAVPNYFVRNLKNGNITPFTAFEDPYPGLRGVTKEVIQFEREDGLPLSGNLYLPAGYKKEDGPLPVFMWAYPREYKSMDAAGQISGSPHEFIRLSWGSPIYWVSRGYAVFDAVSMPIVGEGDEEPNDTFIEQVRMNARAAIKILEDMGVGDPMRIGVGGHSYGAFMTANLLAHTNLFAAGIARSGAYNRTLTPFGFQYEQRTYWESPEVYNNMSPFMHAEKVKTPILLIHGEADNNSGTFPIQSERYYNALKGHGATTRLVMLPHESHGYRAMESVLHMFWEMDNWLEEFVKNRKIEGASTK